MNCPKCKTLLHKKNVKGTEVEECAKCEGIWFEKDELRRIKDQIDSDLNWMDFDIWKHPEKFAGADHRINCPACHQPMSVLNYDQTTVEIDYCTQCRGIWLDKQELQQIIDALEEELLTKSPSDYVKATLEEAKELLTGSESFVSEWRDFTTILRFLQYRILSLKPEYLDTLVGFQKNPLNR